MNDLAMKIFLYKSLNCIADVPEWELMTVLAEYEAIRSMVMNNVDLYPNFYPKGGGTKHIHIHKSYLSTREQLTEVLERNPELQNRLFHFSID